MKRPVFNVAGMMLGVLFVALGCMALRSPTPLMASAVFSSAVAILSLSALLGCVRRERAGWIGMAAFGLVYLHFGFVGGDPGYPALITTAMYAAVADQVMGATPMNPRPLSFIAWTTSTSFGSPAFSFGFDRYPFGQICHSLAALLFGLIGACVGRLVASREGLTDS